ncbi:MAG: glycosyltransferase [Bacteroidales bacterium]|nr:glycosyltransferase [Bacteroidales bacterium]
MKVWVIAGAHPKASRNPMLGIFEWDQAKALQQAGVDVTYLAVDLRSIRRHRKLGYTYGEQDGVKWHSIALPVGAVPPRLLCAIGRLALRVLYRKAFRRAEKPDVLHAHFGVVGSYATGLATQLHTPLVITEHNSALNGVVTDHRIVAESARAYAKAQAVLAVSQPLADSIHRLTGHTAIVVHDMVDTDLFKQCVLRPHEGFRITTVSNLIPLKNTIALLQAIQTLHADYPDILLDIVGEGPLRKELEEFALNQELADVVTFHGRLSREETCKVYEQSDCMALVSRTETFGVVYIEAMAAGLPVIATRCGGPEDFVNESNGVLVDVGDMAQLKSAILWIRANKSQYESGRLRQYVNTHFSPQVIAARLKEVYKGLIPFNRCFNV